VLVCAGNARFVFMHKTSFVSCIYLDAAKRQKKKKNAILQTTVDKNAIFYQKNSKFHSTHRRPL
jgi:hypothetical protein